MTERNIGSLFRIFYLHLFSDGVKVDSCYLIAISKKKKKKSLQHVHWWRIQWGNSWYTVYNKGQGQQCLAFCEATSYVLRFHHRSSKWLHKRNGEWKCKVKKSWESQRRIVGFKSKLQWLCKRLSKLRSNKNTRSLSLVWEYKIANFMIYLSAVYIYNLFDGFMSLHSALVLNQRYFYLLLTLIDCSPHLALSVCGARRSLHIPFSPIGHEGALIYNYCTVVLLSCRRLRS